MEEKRIIEDLVKTKGVVETQEVFSAIQDGVLVMVYPYGIKDGKYTTPRGVTKIANRAFDGLHLREITIGPDVTEIGVGAFFEEYDLEKVNMGENVAKIGAYAFSRCSCLTSIELPKGLKEIGEHAFDECVQLPNMTLPETIETIGKDAFRRTPIEKDVYRQFEEIKKERDAEKGVAKK